MSKRSHRQRPTNGTRWLWVGLVGVLVGLAIGWAVKGPTQAAEPTPAATPVASSLSATDRAALQEFVVQYFSTWSAKDIDGYGRCFHPNARIWFGTASSMALPDFLESQRQAHAQSPVRLTEKALSWDGNVNNGLAQVRVHWELLRGDQAVRGYDFFTLALHQGRWQIVALVFNEE